MSQTLRYRLVTEQDGHQHVSSLLLTEDEIEEALDWEVQLHEATGWKVDRYPGMVRAEKNNQPRWIWVRAKPPEEDTL